MAPDQSWIRRRSPGRQRINLLVRTSQGRAPRARAATSPWVSSMFQNAASATRPFHHNEGVEPPLRSRSISTEVAAMKGPLLHCDARSPFKYRLRKLAPELAVK